MRDLRRAVIAALCAALLMAACTTAPRLEPSPAARAVIIRSSGGTAPFRVAVLEIHDDGCLVYRTNELKRRICSAAVREKVRNGVLSREGFAGAIDALRYVPRTMYGVDEIALLQGNASAEVTLVDMRSRPQFVEWLEKVEALGGFNLRRP